MDMGSISAAVTSLRLAGDITKGLINLKTTAEVQAKAIELGQQIIDAQQQVFEFITERATLLERIRELEGKIERMKDWEVQKKRYKLASPYPGFVVYALQKSMSDGEPPYYLCAACFEIGERSVLLGKEGKPAKEGKPNSVYYCPDPDCRSEAMLPSWYIETAKYFEDIHPTG